jgi:hypothetical protein
VGCLAVSALLFAAGEDPWLPFLKQYKSIKETLRALLCPSAFVAKNVAKKN